MSPLRNLVLAAAGLADAGLAASGLTFAGHAAAGHAVTGHAATGLTAQAGAGTIIPIKVGKGALVFSPNTTTAVPGDILEFQFFGGNHSVVQGTFANACNPSSPAFYSGFGFAGAKGVENENVFRVTVNDTKPIVFYCSQNVNAHCRAGMVGVVNPDEDVTFDKYLMRATAITGNATDPNPAIVAGGVISPASANATNSTSATNGTSSTNGTATMPPSSSSSSYPNATTPTPGSTPSNTSSVAGSFGVSLGMLVALGATAGLFVQT